MGKTEQIKNQKKLMGGYGTWVDACVGRAGGLRPAVLSRRLFRPFFWRLRRRHDG